MLHYQPSSPQQDIVAIESRPDMTRIRRQPANLYRAATEFLLEKIPEDNPNAILDAYLVPSAPTNPSLADVYFGILSSAQNTQMSPRVIGDAIGGVRNLGKVLFKFNVKNVLKKYRDKPDCLLDDIEDVLRPTGEIRRGSRSLWPKYCKTILSAAEFLTQFQNGADFMDWAHYLYKNERSRPALPLLLSAEITGIGHPLACDFLKEFGFIEFGKPDVHIIEIMTGLGYSPVNATPYQLLKRMVELADKEAPSAYALDKLLWLIGSGKLYKHKYLKTWKLGSMKDEFLALYG